MGVGLRSEALAAGHRWAAGRGLREARLVAEQRVGSNGGRDRGAAGSDGANRGDFGAAARVGHVRVAFRGTSRRARSECDHVERGAKTPESVARREPGALVHVGVALIAPVLVLAALAADPRWSSVQPSPLDAGTSLLARTWLHLATLLPLLDTVHRGELALHASIVVLATATALFASSLHDTRSRPFVAAAAGTVVTVSASHWLRWHLAASSRIDQVVPSLAAGIALAFALLVMRAPSAPGTRAARVTILVALGAAAGADARQALDPWPCLLVALASLATSWERITPRDDPSPTPRASLASVVVSLLAIGIAARRGPWIEATVASTRPADAYVHRITLGGPPPRDVLLIHDPALRRELEQALPSALRPDLDFVSPSRASHSEPVRGDTLEVAPLDTSRGVTSDAFWIPGQLAHDRGLELVRELGPLFRHDPLVAAASITAPRWVSVAPANDTMPALDRARLARASLERARFRRAAGRPELAFTAWPFWSERDPDLRERLRLAWLIRASTSPAREPVAIAPTPVHLDVAAFVDPVVAHTLAEIDAAELAFELGRDGLARSLVDDAAAAGRIEAIAALLRWQGHTGARAAFDENAQTLLADTVGRRYAFDSVHWLLQRGFEERARALLITAAPQRDDAAAHVAALLATNVAQTGASPGVSRSTSRRAAQRDAE